MNWTRLALSVSDVLGVMLVLHLFRLRLHSIYSVFSVFIGFDLAVSSVFAFNAATRWFDYRKVYIAVEALTWVLTLWMVYALLQAILAELPGILRFSRYLLNIVFTLALFFGIILSKQVFASAHVAIDGSIGSWLLLVDTLQPIVASVALIVLISILAFVVWFPVELPRNLVFFSFAFIAYFSADTTVLLIRKLVSEALVDKLSIADQALLCGSFLFLMLTLTKQGDRATVRIGHGWEKMQQARLIGQLESVNQALTRRAREV